ncbi:LacI family transcriptional regulator [Pseudonocardia sp. EC080610-09]|uniref:LacI family DNA-binding transcriptional regulator n=1 Tax=unclassified Pseudonocardia TaxID=2619320 RepID=UPI0006CB3DB6|nr:MULTISPECIES: LacI family DNA-binding transcriptional regulator [unclassified Pseudonocardia]ALE72629.1 LacI family transcriptional regulator [Pseudonocardia sp. EC080625-04]ALL75942.1 LacI family transcriptional regulator [Pseudonocardia sp. EC080610-09]ALL82970.1 LacI family transcriptional regulator [Pseudonocardia sp. EC080619-01]
MTTMRDVAARAGVSAKTVSRVFNDDEHVLPETRTRVESALRELNYVPNSVATTFRKGRAPVVGVVVPDLLDPFFAAVAESVNRLALDRGMSTVVTSVGHTTRTEHETIGRLLSQSLSGLVVAPVEADHSYLARWRERLPIVFVDRAPVGVAADSFIEDDAGGARAATEHLIGHGHERIAFVGDLPELPTARNRLLGYRGALADAGLTVPEGYEEFGAIDRASAAAVVGRLDALPGPPTAILSSNARSSMALVPVLRHRRLAVVGFGDFPMADMLSPALTVVDQDPFALGEHAAQRVFDRLDHPRRRFRRRTVLPVRLVERESCR